MATRTHRCAECGQPARHAVPFIRLRSGETRYVCRPCFDGLEYGAYMPQTLEAFRLFSL